MALLTNGRRILLLATIFAISVDVSRFIRVLAFFVFESDDDIAASYVRTKSWGHHERDRRRRLREAEQGNGDDADDDNWFADVPRILSLASTDTESSPSQSREEQEERQNPFRVLLITTSLVEYDKGTKGTKIGYDRLQHVMLPQLVDSITSMTSRGWSVDLYLVLGYSRLEPDRRELIREALPEGVGLEVWEDAIPYFYANSYNKRPMVDQSLEESVTGLPRQHRFVLRDKLPFYDFFVCFEDDMRITADHVVTFLELSSDIKQLHDEALASPDGLARVSNPSDIPRSQRHKPTDGASVGNDVVDDPISANDIKLLFPGLIRVEVLDRGDDHPLRRPGVLENSSFLKEVPPSSNAFRADDGESLLSPNACCEEDNDPPRGKMTPHPQISEVVLWEANIRAAGVRRLPGPIGWVAAYRPHMHVLNFRGARLNDTDAGSYWSGYPDVYGPSDENMTRPRFKDATIGNAAGFMATRSQIEYFHNEACPGGFLPSYDSRHWKGDSLQRHSTPFWSGGFQLFGQCYLNRILSLEPRKFERQLVYHVSNNKQRTISRVAAAKKFIRAGDFYGQIMKVKERAEQFVMARDGSRRRSNLLDDDDDNERGAWEI